MKKLYKIAKNANVGDTIQCPGCGKEIIKTTYNKIFCSNQKTKRAYNCKDKYWNTVTPQKRCNTTRISPASREWMKRREESTYYNEHPFSSEALGQWDD